MAPPILFAGGFLAITWAGTFIAMRTVRKARGYAVDDDGDCITYGEHPHLPDALNVSGEGR